MGGCLSKKLGLPAHSNEKRRKARWTEKRRHLELERERRPSPLPPEDKAVVKEVLTEMPKYSCAAVAAGSGSRKAEDITPREAVVGPGRRTSVEYRKCGLEGLVKGEASEIYNASESFSVSTTVTEKKDMGADELEDEASSSCKRQPADRRPAPNRSPRGKSYPQRKRCSATGEFAAKITEAKRGGGRGAGRPSPSLVKRPANGRTFTAGGDTAYAGSARTNRVERSRTTRSPAPSAKRGPTSGDGRGRGRAGRSSPKTTVEPRTTRQPEDGCEQMTTRVGAAEGGELAVPPVPEPVPEAALENPLVSLECFIFL